MKQKKNEGAIKNLLFVGIGGISMSALAKTFLQYGFCINGVDDSLSEVTDELIECGVGIWEGFSSDFVRNCDALVVSSAINESNLNIVLAKKLNKPIFTRAEILGLLSKIHKNTISVSGSHGKTTCASLIAHILTQCGLKPNVHIGGAQENSSGSCKISSSEIFLTEACEYKDSFLQLSSNISIILNIQPDHLDYFKTFENLKSSFEKFAKKTQNLLIINGDEEECKDIKNDNYLTFGLSKQCDYQARDIIALEDGTYTFKLFYHNENLGQFNSFLIGKHNIYNLLAALVVSNYLGLDLTAVRNSINSFKAVRRRNEFVCEINGAKIYHDYAHHPTEITSVVESYRKICKGRLYLIFQPHTYTRTRDLYEDFVKSLYADQVWLLPIYPAREEAIEGINSKALTKSVKKEGQKARYIKSFDSCKKRIINKAKKGDIFAILGAGDIVKLAYSLKK